MGEGQGRLKGRLCVLPATITFHGRPTQHTEHHQNEFANGNSTKRWPAVLGLIKAALIRNGKH